MLIKSRKYKKKLTRYVSKAYTKNDYEEKLKFIKDSDHEIYYLKRELENHKQNLKNRKFFTDNINKYISSVKNLQYDSDSSKEDFVLLSKKIHKFCDHKYISFVSCIEVKNKRYTSYSDRKVDGKLFLKLRCHCGDHISGCHECCIKYCETCFHVKKEYECSSCCESY